MPENYNVSQLEDINGDIAALLAKRLETAIKFAIEGDVSGESASTFLNGNVSITVSIGAGKVKSSHIANDAVKAEHVNDGETLPVDISGNAATATKATKDGDGNVIKNTYLKIDDAAGNSGYIPKSQKGVANGVATLDDDGKVPSSQLPSYVDDTIEGYLYNGSFYSDANHTILIAPESGKIYVELATNRSYRWSGSQYTEISKSLALGETSSTAYRGDRGKTAYDHSQQTGNPHNTSLSDLGVTATASELNVLDGIDVTVTELNSLDGVTGNVQTQLDAKATPADITSAIASEVTNRNNAISSAINDLYGNATSSDGTNVQVKVTVTNGVVTAVNIVTDNTASSAQLQSEANARIAADDALAARATALENGKANSSHTHTTSDITDFPTLGNAASKNVGTGANDVAAGNHGHTKDQVGLGNVDNTSDANKPVSTAQQAALDTKADKVSSATNGHLAGLDANGNMKDSGYGVKKSSDTSSWSDDDANLPTRGAVQAKLNAIESGSDQRVLEHELNCDNPHGVNLKQLNIPNLGRCVYDSNTHTLKMLDVRFSSKGSPVETDDPQIGDALYLDSNNKRKWLKGGDLLYGCTIPSGYVPVGVVIKRLGDDVLIHYYDCSVNKKFASAWMWEITGMTLDGTSRNIVFRQHKEDNTAVTIGTFTYSATTMADFCTALDTWLRANPGGTAAGASWNYNWHCEYAENYQGNLSCIVIADNMVHVRQANSIVSSGATASMNMAYMLPAISESVGFERMGGSHGIRAGANAERLIEYYSSNAGSTATLTSDVTPTTAGTVVSKTQFEEDSHCAPLRAVYKTFEEYIKKCVMLKWPSFKYGMATTYGKANEWTYALAKKTDSQTGNLVTRQHFNINGEAVTTFPAADFAASINFNSPGLDAGNWRMMGVEDTFEMIRNMKAGLSGHSSYAGFDLVNKTLYAMKGDDSSSVKLTSARWLAVRYNTYNAWDFGNTGSFGSNPFYYAFRVSAVALLTL